MCTLSSENPCLQVLKTSRKEHSRKEHSGSPNNADQQLMKCLTLTASTHAVLPSDSLSVSELLKLYLPSFSSIIPSIEPELCFSNHPPTESIPSYLSHPVPPAAAFVEGPHNISRKGMLKGKLSIMDWTCKNSMSYFLFELIMFWSSLSRFIHAQQEWEVALQWFEKATSDDSLAKEVDEVHLILWTTYSLECWSTNSPFIHHISGDGHVSVKQLAFKQSDQHGTFKHCCSSASDLWCRREISISSWYYHSLRTFGFITTLA